MQSSGAATAGLQRLSTGAVDVGAARRAIARTPTRNMQRIGMNDYELSTPRAGVSLAALAMTVITMGSLIVLPSMLAYSRAVMNGSTEVAAAGPLIDRPHVSECAAGSGSSCTAPEASECGEGSTD